MKKKNSTPKPKSVFNRNGREAGASKFYNMSPIAGIFFPTYNAVQQIWNFTRRSRGLETMIFFCGTLAAMGWRPGDIIPHHEFVIKIWDLMKRRKAGEIGDRALSSEIDRMIAQDWNVLASFEDRPDQAWIPEVVPPTKQKPE